MQTKESRLTECKFVLLLSQLTEEGKRELFDLMQWIEASNPTPEEFEAEMNRREASLK